MLFFSVYLRKARQVFGFNINNYRSWPYICLHVISCISVVLNIISNLSSVLLSQT